MNSNVAGRNLIVAIILSLFTFGIYTIYWMYMLDLETAELSGEGALGILLIVLNFITFGIYGLYWNYKVGSTRMPRIKGKDEGALYLILAIFSLNMIPLVLMQDAINDKVSY